MCSCGCGAYMGQCLGQWHSLQHSEVIRVRARADVLVDEIRRQDAVIDQLHTQLADVANVATGETQRVTQGKYGWSPTYQDVLSLRLKYDELLEIVEALCPHILDVRRVKDAP
jgi:hypothetical protein